VSHALSSKTRQVRDYYDANTARFERFGQGRRTGAIHRAVWSNEVRSRDAAFEHLNELVRREAEALACERDVPLHVLDLGCGVGGSLIFLASRSGLTGTGATLSRVQAERARERVRRAGLDARVTIVQADFERLPDAVPVAHLAYAIEAFVHAADPAAFFRSAARHVLEGGLLIVCDDFLRRHETALAAGERRTVERVRRGWLTHSLITPAEASAHAERAGFRPLKDVDLTPYLELGRPRDRLIRALLALGSALPVPGHAWRSLVGGSALQTALGTGLIDFRFMVWRRC
jgi:cyclopropane fatty-acyl-phospholipid synthase-like methyltransferase